MKNRLLKNRGDKKANLAEKIEYHGICPSCENFALCSYIHNDAQREPVLFCEEFISKSAPEKASAGKIKETVNEYRGIPGRNKGLCATCENRDGCDFPKDEAGVWRCEMYR